MLIIDERQFMQILPTIMYKGGAVCVRPSTTFVSLGLTEDVNEEYCIKHNIPLFKIGREGGAIVSRVGDYGVIIINKARISKSLPQILQKLMYVLLKNNLDVKIEDNDILIDGYKTASYAYRILDNGLTYLAIHITMSIDLDLIKNICKKEMKKVPRGLNDFGIYEDTIDNIIMNM